jgi:hypothetical protein
MAEAEKNELYLGEGETYIYLSHEWSTAPSFMINPSFAHTTITDSVKKPILLIDP